MNPEHERGDTFIARHKILAIAGVSLATLVILESENIPVVHAIRASVDFAKDLAGF